MYSKDFLYKFNIKVEDFNSFYTGKVIEEDETSIKIITIRNETLIIKKENILKARELSENGTGRNRSL